MEKILNPITNTLAALQPLSASATADLDGIIKPMPATANDMLLDLGKIATAMYFVKTGLARVFYYHNGRDVTDYFAIDGQFIGAIPSLFNHQPSQKAIQAIENSKLFYFRMEEFEACCARHHDLERAARKLAFFAMLEEQEKIKSLRFYSAKQRYELLEKKYPGIVNRCPLQFIASYIGTTQVSISRIRAGLQ